MTEEQLEQIFDHLHLDHKKFNLMLYWGEIFTNQHLGMKADLKITVLVVSE